MRGGIQNDEADTTPVEIVIRSDAVVNDNGRRLSVDIVRGRELLLNGKTFCIGISISNQSVVQTQTGYSFLRK